MSYFDEFEGTDVPPQFKVCADENAIEGNYAWDADPIDSGAALQIAADYLGPLMSADVLARHWVHTGRANDLVTMAEHLLALHFRLTGR